jgi:hypothetical protein
MKRLSVILSALLMVAGFATETGAFAERRMRPRQPIPYSIRARGGLPPVTYYGRPLYRGYSRYYGGYGRSYGYAPHRYGYRSYGYRSYGYRSYGYRRWR